MDVESKDPSVTSQEVEQGMLASEAAKDNIEKKFQNRTLKRIGTSVGNKKDVVCFLIYQHNKYLLLRLLSCLLDFQGNSSILKFFQGSSSSFPRANHASEIFRQGQASLKPFSGEELFSSTYSTLVTISPL